jgi:hypothetical protein
MRCLRFAALTAALLALSTAAAWANAVPGFSDKHISLLENRGLPMTQQDALERINFHPFVPSTDYGMVALLPAFHGDDKDNPENRGIGYSYMSGGILYVLREWPLSGASLSAYPSVAPMGTCGTGHLVLGTVLHPRAYAWTTATLAFALQPDIDPGANPDERALKKEWARLVKRGACR